MRPPEDKVMREGSSFEGLEEFVGVLNKRYSGRPTRIGMFEPGSSGVMDYWIENGLPLAQVEIEQLDGHVRLRVTAGEYSHEIEDPIRVSFHTTLRSEEDGVDIAESTGRTLVVRFD